jgi:hypothetical protein
MENQRLKREMVGPEGPQNLKKISSLTLRGTNIPLYKDQWLSKVAVPLFPDISGPSSRVVLPPGRHA